MSLGLTQETESGAQKPLADINGLSQVLSAIK